MAATADASVYAQPRTAEIRINQLQLPSPDSRFTRSEGSFSTFDSGIAFGVRATLDYANSPLISTVVGSSAAGADSLSKQDRATVEHAVLMHLGVSFLPVDWLMFEFDLPLAVHLSGEDNNSVPRQPVPAGVAPALADPRFGLLFRPYESDVVDVTFGARLWAPLGSTAAYLTGPKKFARGEVLVAVAGNADVVDYGCTLSVAPLLFIGRDGDRGALSCAAHFRLAPMISAGIEPHLALFSYAPRGASDPGGTGLGDATIAVQFEPLLAATANYQGVGLTLAGGPGFGGAPGAAAGRFILSVSYTQHGQHQIEEAKPDDRDMDGVVDDFDACPDEAGTKARSGCPADHDRDGDGIIDGDACPNDAGAKYDDPAANGCPDADNDHFADPVDRCPIEPGKRNGCPRYARLRKTKFVTNPPMRFVRGSFRLPGRARAALFEIIATMQANPDFGKLILSLGTKATHPKLTQRRVARLNKLLDHQNLDADRFQINKDKTQTGGTLKVGVMR